MNNNKILHRDSCALLDPTRKKNPVFDFLRIRLITSFVPKVLAVTEIPSGCVAHDFSSNWLFYHRFLPKLGRHRNQTQ